MIPKPCVAGSNPAGGTTSEQLFHHLDPRSSVARGNALVTTSVGCYRQAMAERRIRERGHIHQQPNGTYRVIVYAGRDPFTRRERRLTGTANTPREAERLGTRLLAQVDGQRIPTPRRPSASSSTAGSRRPTSS